jgi:hypothetical protein
VRSLQRAGALAHGKACNLRYANLPDVVHMQMGAANTIGLRYVVAGVQRWQGVALTYTTPNYGGSRPWFLCDCSRRVAKLYRVGARWGCRNCCGLDYETQHEDRFLRGYRALVAIHRRLGSPWPDDGTFRFFPPVPDRPRGMHMGTYYRLQLRLVIHEREMFRDIEEMAAQLTALGG